VNYDNLLVVIITVTCYLWVPLPDQWPFIYIWRHVEAATLVYTLYYSASFKKIRLNLKRLNIFCLHFATIFLIHQPYSVMETHKLYILQH